MGTVTARRVVVAGASDTGGDMGRTILRELRSLGYDAVAVNPDADQVDGRPCYRHLSAVPPPIDALVLAVAEERATEVVDAAAACGIRRVWVVRGVRASSTVSETTRRRCADRGIELVTGLGPLLFLASDGWLDPRRPR